MSMSTNSSGIVCAANEYPRSTTSSSASSSGRSNPAAPAASADQQLRYNADLLYDMTLKRVLKESTTISEVMDEDDEIEMDDVTASSPDKRMMDIMAEMMDIFLDVTDSSPYLTEEQKTQVKCSLLSRTDNVFCAMARLVLSHSPKLRAFPAERRRRFLIDLQRRTTAYQVVDLVLQQLPLEALSLNYQERKLVAMDILEHRYYRLLPATVILAPSSTTPSLPTTRTAIANNEPQQEECSICLSALDDDALLDQRTSIIELHCCRQNVCVACHNEWSKSSSECPLCRSTQQPVLFHI